MFIMTFKNQEYGNLSSNRSVASMEEHIFLEKAYCMWNGDFAEKIAPIVRWRWSCADAMVANFSFSYLWPTYHSLNTVSHRILRSTKYLSSHNCVHFLIIHESTRLDDRQKEAEENFLPFTIITFMDRIFIFYTNAAFRVIQKSRASLAYVVMKDETCIFITRIIQKWNNCCLLNICVIM